VSAECGTVAGYFRHRRAGQEQCQPCRDAMNASNWDRAPHRKARHPALTRLAQRHPEEYRVLLAEEKARLAAGDGR